MIAQVLNKWVLTALLALMATEAAAQSVVSVRPIRMNSVISPHDVRLIDDVLAGAATRLEDVIGQEARVTIYQGKPVRHADIGPAAMIDRNQDIEMVYRLRGLVISAVGRSLGRAGIGEKIRVMNLDSKTIVFATVTGPSTVEVSN